MTEPIISINDLSVYFNKKKALNNVTMDFYPNEITALIGPSGSGKSTLLRSINRMGDLNPEWTLTGAVSYNGYNVYSPRTDIVELRKEIGMVFQQPNPFPMSIYENVVYGLRINGIKDKAVLDQAVEESLKGASIWEEVKDRLHDSALGLSGGQQQRVMGPEAPVISGIAHDRSEALATVRGVPNEPGMAAKQCKPQCYLLHFSWRW